jgi:hypothetical protein
MLKAIVLSFLALGAASGTTLADDTLWLHIRVAGDTEDEKVSVNLPIALVESVLPMIESNDFEDGRIRINEAEFDGADLRRLWEQLAKAEDGEFLTIEKRDESVRVAKDKGLLRIFASDEEEGDDVEMRSRSSDRRDDLVRDRGRTRSTWRRPQGPPRQWPPSSCVRMTMSRCVSGSMRIEDD